MNITIRSKYKGFTLEQYHLFIDDKKWTYFTWEEDELLAKQYSNPSYTALESGQGVYPYTLHKLPGLLPMDEENPRKTIDNFYKLLILQ